MLAGWNASSHEPHLPLAMAPRLDTVSLIESTTSDYGLFARTRLFLTVAPTVVSLAPPVASATALLAILTSLASAITLFVSSISSKVSLFYRPSKALLLDISIRAR